MTARVYDALVIGAGIHGLSALYHLKRLGCRDLALVEQFKLGHTRGSSHGAGRITRSSYEHVRYVRLMQVVHSEEWPRLEREAGCQLIHPTPGCLWGAPDSPLEAYADAVAKAGLDVDVINDCPPTTVALMIESCAPAPATLRPGTPV